jgi:hypothetical protein
VRRGDACKEDNEEEDDDDITTPSACDAPAGAEADEAAEPWERARIPLDKNPPPVLSLFV